MDDATLDPKEQRTETRGRVMRALMSPFEGITRRSLGGLLDGVTFGGRRDAYQALGYKRILFSRDYRARYKRGGVSKRIVDAMPNSCWRGGASIYNDENPQVTTSFEQAWLDLDRRLKIWNVFERADILAGLGRYAIILIGAPGDMSKPLVSAGPQDIKFLTPYAEADAFITQYEQNDQSERFGLPVMYSLRRTYIQWPGQMNPPVLPAKPVHYSRVVHIADGLLDDHVFGTPRLEAVWNYIDDLDKIVGGGSEAFWKRADGGMVYNIDKDMVFDPDPTKAEAAKKEMKEKMEAFTNELERQFISRGIDVKRLGSDVADIKNPIDAVMSLISAVTGVPQRILMGSEMGKLASSKDKSNWDDRVQDRRENFCENIVVFPFVDHLIELGALPDPGEDHYECDWPETDELDQGQRVSAAVQVSNVNKNEGTPVVTPSEIRTVYLGLEPLTPEQQTEVDQIKAEKLAAQQPQGPQPQAPGASAQPTDVPGAPPPSDDKATLAAALEAAIDADDVDAAVDAMVALMKSAGGPGSGPQKGGKAKTVGEKASDTSAVAHEASRKAAVEGTIDAHERAQHAHEKAAALHKENNASTLASIHSQHATYHDGERAKLVAHNEKPGGPFDRYK